MKDNEVTLEQWIEALRSGDYKQGMRYLCKFDDSGEACYCAVGVLAELLYGEDSWSPSVFDPNVLAAANGSVHAIYYVDEELGRSMVDTAMRLNDEGLTFEEIAEIAESLTHE